VDARILAEVYLQLKGGREQRLVFEDEVVVVESDVVRTVQFVRREPRPAPLAARITEEEAAAHAAFIEKLGPNALWLKAS